MSSNSPDLVMPARPQRRTLGKGLGALLGEAAEDYSQLDQARAPRQVPIEQLSPGPFQPRRYFDDVALTELAQSIKECGILQPILVRRTPGQVHSYQIIAGERRWRAAQKAGLHEVPVVINDLTDTKALEAAIIENVQREDLNAIEEAEGYQRLISEFNHTHEALAQIVGKSRAYISNTLRLLKLPQTVRDKVIEGAISAGHARAILASDNPDEMLARILAEGLSVRDAENLTREGLGENAKKKEMKPRANSKLRDPNIEALEQEVCTQLGLKVTIAGSGQAGTVMIRYQSLDQLDQLLLRLCGHAPNR
jgi:ParB family chromosome partitioning protein